RVELARTARSINKFSWAIFCYCLLRKKRYAICDCALTEEAHFMAESAKFVLLNGDDMEDFHDYEDEEQGGVGSKLDEFEDIEEEDEDIEVPGAVETVVEIGRAHV